MAEQQQQKKSAVVAEVPAQSKPSDPLEAAKAEIASLKSQLDRQRVLVNSTQPRAVVPGTVTYRMTKRSYRLGVLREPGDTITVTDEVPGKTWVRVSDEELKAMKAGIEAKSAANPQRVPEREV